MQHGEQQVVGKKYILGKVLGSGDFDCRVRLCTNNVTGTVYAVRIYDKAILQEADWIWNQLAEAVQVMRAMPKHEHIVEMVECFETHTSLFILMNYVKGVSLTRLLAKPLQLVLMPWSDPTLASSKPPANPYGQSSPRRDASRPLAAEPMVPSPVSPLIAKRSLLSLATEPAPATGGVADARRGGGRGSLESSVLQRGSTEAERSVIPLQAFWERVPSIFFQILTGIQHMHSNNFVHLGIAPDHILLTEKDVVKITFLVMCRIATPEKRFTDLTGTTHTAAPEVLAEAPGGYDPRLADAWSCGVVLYFMLSGGIYPFSGANAKRNIANYDIRPLDPRLPRNAVDLVSQLLQPKPDRRLTITAALKHPYLHAAAQLASNSGPTWFSPSHFGVVSFYDRHAQRPVIRRVPRHLDERVRAALVLQPYFMVLIHQRHEINGTVSANEGRLASTAPSMAANGENPSGGGSPTGASSPSHRSRVGGDGPGSGSSGLSSGPGAAGGAGGTGSGTSSATSLSSMAFLATPPPWQVAHMCSTCKRMPPPRVESGKLPFPDTAAKLRYESPGSVPPWPAASPPGDASSALVARRSSERSTTLSHSIETALIKSSREQPRVIPLGALPNLSAPFPATSLVYRGGQFVKKTQLTAITSH